jgi:putative nucleotidyltransferase with HDIG domain
MQPETLDNSFDTIIIDEKAQDASTPSANGASTHVASSLDGEAALLELEGEGAGVLGALREPWAARLAGRMGRHHAVLMLLSIVLLWLVAALPAGRGIPALEIGQPAPREVIAPATALVPDRESTELRRRDAAALVPPVYDGDPQAQRRALSRLRVLLIQAQQQSRTPTLPNSQTLNRLRWDWVSDAASDAVRAVYRRAQLRSDVPTDIAAARTHIATALQVASQQLNLSDLETTRAGELARAAARTPNLLVNERATQRARREAQDDAHAVYERVQAGDTILQAGELVTPDKWAQLQELGLVAPHLRWGDRQAADWSSPFWKNLLARGALCVLLVLLAAGYVATLDRPLLKKPAALWLAAMTPILFLSFQRTLLHLPHADLLLVPLAATAAMLLTILLEARLGLLAGLLVAVPGVLLAQGDSGLFLSASLSAWVGALSVANISSRRDVGRAALVLAATNAVLAFSFGILRETPSETLLSMALWSALAGAFSVIAGSGLAMALERPFGITTPLRLLELLAPDELVLRRLQTEAPGTYTHSLMVSLLAEAAAKSVEADALLCRVGGLYHDIGKLRRPHCFIENQAGDNIHDRLSAQLSARIIIAHVRDGLALGRALKLPQPILDIIAQHHGDSRTEYFYRRALDQNAVLDSRLAFPVEESAFRYPGPRPQSKEAAIVMLADTIEASARALPQPTPEKLKHHVQSMIAQKLRDGELDECDLTLRDLGTVEDGFLHVLRGVLHHRIAYPGDKTQAQTTSEEAAAERGELEALRAQLQAPPKPDASATVDPKFGATIGKRKLRRLRRLRSARVGQPEGTRSGVAQSGALSSPPHENATVAAPREYSRETSGAPRS